MNIIVKGHQGVYENNKHKVIEVDVPLDASRSARVWLVNGGCRDHDDNNNPFRMIVGATTQEDAARAYAKQRKDFGCVPPTIFRVFPLASLEPIALTGVIDDDGDEEWSAFQDAWIEVRL